MDTTIPVTMDDIIHHTKAVKRYIDVLLDCDVLVPLTDCFLSLFPHH